MNKGHLIILSGPSGVGKNRVESDLRKLLPNLKRVITYTSRDKRPNEKNGVDYHFVSKGELQKMIDAEEMLEWANVYEHLYGSRKEDVQKMVDGGDLVLMIVDVQGALTIKNNLEDAHLIFIDPESIDQLKMHLAKRKNMKPEDLKVRIKNAENEIKLKDQYDHVVLNVEGRINQTSKKIVDIIKGIAKGSDA